MKTTIKKFGSYLEEASQSVLPNSSFLGNIKQLENAIKARVGKFTRLGYEPLIMSKFRTRYGNYIYF